MRKLRWQFLIIFMTGLVVGFLLITEQPKANEFLPEPAKGGIYAEALIGSMQRLNPLLDYYNPVDRDVNSLIFSSLLKFDDRGMPQPDLAESWGVSRDGTIYNLTLKNNAKWHDGTPVSSDDVLFTVEMLRSGGEVVPIDLQEFWSEIDVVLLNEITLQFRLPDAFAPFPDYLTFGILPKHLLGNLTFEEMIEAPFNLEPIGSGPYQFDQFIVENQQIDGLVLTVNEDYYEESAYIEQLVFRYYPDGQSALDAYHEGEVLSISNVTPDILQEVLKEPELLLYSGRMPELTMIFLNLNNPEVPFLQEADVRKSLMMGINRQFLVDKFLNGQAVLATVPILPGTWAYYDGLPPIDFDQELAKQILRDAEYSIVSREETPDPASSGGEGEAAETAGDEELVLEKDDRALSFDMIYPDDDYHKQLAEKIQSDWALIDVSVNIIPLPYEEIINGRLQARDYEAALVTMNLSGSPDPDPYPFWDQSQATGGQNYSQWDNRIASEYLEKARVSIDISDREKFYRNFQVVFYDEMPSLPLYFPIYSFAVDQQVQNVRVGPIFDSSDRYSTVLDWFLVTTSNRPGLFESEDQGE
ncbi:MAG: peptide ABC transporter substrate-binding protein [Anaerolineaceae bacterium]|nr:peptide ABC transporter substrate-binding protein [Anaerolineaceae bacterium]